ncbi:hypothetical protein DPEC_G00258090 [Dallia pectoralis]|uniref:Uncharacterized protein n=1 Tax=Dallia pectoralis TaxID=75939 RepID=A0ACC2FQZ5_DALPE|nr:hypothetical protein DPEC_G00258090 [Dallia pectoralis]
MGPIFASLTSSPKILDKSQIKPGDLELVKSGIAKPVMSGVSDLQLVSSRAPNPNPVPSCHNCHNCPVRSSPL